MGLPLSGSKDRALLKVQTEDLLLLIRGRPVHPTVEQLQLHQNSKGEWEKATINIVSFNKSCEAHIFDPLGGGENDSLSQYTPGSMVFPCFYEQQTYNLQIQSISGKQLNFYHDNKYIRETVQPFGHNIISGNINFKNDIGLTEFQVLSGGRPLLKIRLEVFPSKIDYRRDFHELLKDVNEELYNLAYDFLRRTFFGANSTPAVKQSHSEFFSIISLIFDKLVRALEMVNNNPHHKIIRVNQINCVEKVKRFDQQSAKWLSKHPSVLQRTLNNQGIQIMGNSYVPLKLRESKKVITYDTFENRFIKLVLNSITKKITGFRQEYLSLYASDNSRYDASIDNKISQMLNKLRALSRKEFLLETSELHKLDNMSLVLQMAPGYTEVYRYYLMLIKGLSIQSDVFQLSLKDLAVLYEYWCFLSLNKLLKKKYKLLKSDLVKVSNKGLVITLRKDKKATLHYKNEANGETFTLSYQNQTSGPTNVQVPDNVLSIAKEGSDVSYNYVFDAKYRINPAVDKRYLERHKKPGPEEDDINTMHRYRDAMVYGNKTDGFKRSVFGAYVLFPYSDEDKYSGRTDGQPHSFFESIEQVNIGGLPFLPGHTQLVEEVLDDLILDSPDTSNERALVHDGTEEYYYNKFVNRNVFIGSLRTKEQWDKNCSFLFYHTPIENVIDVLGNLEYVAIYRRKELFGADNGIKHYGKIKSYKILPREDITEIKSKRKGRYVRFEIEQWKELPNKIVPLQYGVYDRLITTLPLLLSARELPELSLKTEDEIRLWRELRRISPAFNVRPDRIIMDQAALEQIENKVGGRIYLKNELLIVETPDTLKSWSLNDLSRNRIRVYKELRKFICFRSVSKCGTDGT